MKQLVLMLTVSYREIGMNCDYVAKGETEEELVKDAGQPINQLLMKDHQRYNKSTFI